MLHKQTIRNNRCVHNKQKVRVKQERNRVPNPYSSSYAIRYTKLKNTEYEYKPSKLILETIAIPLGAETLQDNQEYLREIFDQKNQHTVTYNRERPRNN